MKLSPLYLVEVVRDGIKENYKFDLFNAQKTIIDNLADENVVSLSIKVMAVDKTKSLG